MYLPIRRHVAVVVAVLLPLAALLGAQPAVAQGRPTVTCKACLLVSDEGEELFVRAASRPRPNASTTKMLTALVVLANASLREEVTVSATAAATPEGKLALEAGERFTVGELLQGLLLNSSNDAAVALAEHVAGSEEAFVAFMNERANGLGATDTHFVTAHGLDAPEHLTTARDLVVIAKAFLAKPRLAAIVARATATIASAQRVVELINTNELIPSYLGATGVKTGFTEDAGNVLVASATRDGRSLIAVVMDSEDHFMDSAALLDYGFARLARGILLDDMTQLTDLVLDPGGSTGTVAVGTVRGSNRPDEVTIEFLSAVNLAAPIDPGQVVGTAVVFDLRGTEVGRLQVVATGEVAASGSGWMARALGTVIGTAARLLPGEY